MDPAEKNPHPAAAVVLLSELTPGALQGLLAPYGLVLDWRAAGADIPGSYWQAPEAGLIGNHLVLRTDTPVHSALHEACHFICADGARRAALHTDAGGDDLEECAVCYLQCLLAPALPGYSRERMWADMDAWGYSFRLGSAERWFREDAEDAREWLSSRGLI
jgi:hypothetical protein